MRRMLLLTAALLIAGVLAGCGPEFPVEEPDIEGLVTTANIAEPGVTILIEVPAEEREPEWSSRIALEKASVTVQRDALVFDSDGDEVDLARIAVEGVRVRAWFSGPVAESYPVQARARAVQLLDEP